jgi:hypothetical protein
VIDARLNFSLRNHDVERVEIARLNYIKPISALLSCLDSEDIVGSNKYRIDSLSLHG